jgi:hypothetical protein
VHRQLARPGNDGTEVVPPVRFAPQGGGDQAGGDAEQDEGDDDLQQGEPDGG